MPRGVRWAGDDSTSLAANWWVVLAIDAAMGVAVVAAGLVVALGARQRWAWLLVGAGAVYLFFVGGRATRWARRRRDAGDRSGPS